MEATEYIYVCVLYAFRDSRAIQCLLVLQYEAVNYFVCLFVYVYFRLFLESSSDNHKS